MTFCNGQNITVYPSISGADVPRAAQFLFSANCVFAITGYSVTFEFKSTRRTVDLRELVPKSLRTKNQDDDYSYAFGNEMLVIRDRSSLFVFTYKSGAFNFYKYLGIRNRFPHKNMQLNDSVLTLFGLYNDHPNGRNASGILWLDMHTRSESLTEPDFKHPGMTHIAPNNFLSVQADFYLVTDPLAYRVRFYHNKSNHQFDSIIADDSSFVRMSAKNLSYFDSKFEHPKFWGEPVPLINEMISFLKDKDHIWQTFVLDSETVFIRLSRGTMSSARILFYDHVWKKVDGIWTLQISRPLDLTIANDQCKDKWPYFVPYTSLVANNGKLEYMFWTQPSKLNSGSCSDIFNYRSNRSEVKLARMTMRW